MPSRSARDLSGAASRSPRRRRLRSPWPACWTSQAFPRSLSAGGSWKVSRRRPRREARPGWPGPCARKPGGRDPGKGAEGPRPGGGPTRGRRRRWSPARSPRPALFSSPRAWRGRARRRGSVPRRAAAGQSPLAGTGLLWAPSDPTWLKSGQLAGNVRLDLLIRAGFRHEDILVEAEILWRQHRRVLERDAGDVGLPERADQVQEEICVGWREVGSHAVLDGSRRGDQRRSDWDAALELAQDGKQHQLLPPGTIRLGRAEARARVLQGSRAVEDLGACIEVDVDRLLFLVRRILRIVERFGDGHPNAADRIDQRCKCLDVDGDPCIDGLSDGRRDRRGGKVTRTGWRAPLLAQECRVVGGADGERGVQLALHGSVRGCGYVDPEVAGQRNHGGLMRCGTNREDQHRVGEIRVVVARATVREEEKVDAFVRFDFLSHRPRALIRSRDQRQYVPGARPRSHRANGDDRPRRRRKQGDRHHARKQLERASPAHQIQFRRRLTSLLGGSSIMRTISRARALAWL